MKLPHLVSSRIGQVRNKKKGHAPKKDDLTICFTGKGIRESQVWGNTKESKLKYAVNRGGGDEKKRETLALMHPKQWFGIHER